MPTAARQDDRGGARAARAQSAGDHPDASGGERQRTAERKYDALVDYGLDDFYWRGVASIYGYESPTPSVDDFVLWMFRKAIEGFKSERPGGLQNIQLDFASLRNDRRSQDALATLAKRAAARPRLRLAPSKMRASATSCPSTSSRRPTRRSSVTWRARWPSGPSPRAKSPRSCARGKAACGSTATSSSTRRSPARQSCWPNWRRWTSLRSRSTRHWSGTGATGSASTSSIGSSPTRPDLPKCPQPAGGAARASREALHQQLRLRAGQRMAAEG